MGILETLKKWFSDDSDEKDRPFKDNQSFIIQHDHTQGINSNMNSSGTGYSSWDSQHYSNSSDNFN